MSTAISRLFGPLVVPNGKTLLGPFPVSAGLQQVEFTLEVALLLPSLEVAVEYSDDAGISWKEIARATFDGPGRDRLGAPAPTLHFAMTLGGNAQGRRVTSDNSQVRAWITSTLSFLSNGGSMVVT